MIASNCGSPATGLCRDGPAAQDRQRWKRAWINRGLMVGLLGHPAPLSCTRARAQAASRRRWASGSWPVRGVRPDPPARVGPSAHPPFSLWLACGLRLRACPRARSREHQHRGASHAPRLVGPADLGDEPDPRPADSQRFAVWCRRGRNQGSRLDHPGRFRQAQQLDQGNSCPDPFGARDDGVFTLGVAAG